MEGELVAERFRVGERVGAGGMGTIYRATDETSGELVAIKAVRESVADAAARFDREVAALERLDHPSVVRYIARGETARGPYLVMEWLAGEDLSTRLKRAGLTLDETLAIARQTARALAAAHQAGVIHRDIKPANLFFVDRSVDRLKIVDFGLARLTTETDFLSVSGMLIGTPGYMAPEQARGERDIDGRVDVFALGCLLYKCIAGKNPFAGPDAVATLAKIFFDDPKPLVDVPEALASVIGAMLSKDREHRPTAAEVAERLDAIALAPSGRASVATSPPPALTDREQRIVSVVIAAAGWSGDAEVRVERAPRAAIGERIGELKSLGERWGARIEVLADAVVATLFGAGGATDQAARAARLSLDLARKLPDASVAVATGRAEVGRRVVGEVIDRAWEMLAAVTPHIRLDDVTAGLLDATFDVHEMGDALVLVRERSVEPGVRTLLGKATPCVGRDREMRALDALFDECANEPIARAVLVQAPAGLGKSRLRHEWLGSLARRCPNARILLARAEPVAASAPHFLASQWVREAAGLGSSPRGSVARAALSAYLHEVVERDDATRVTEFLAEMLGLGSRDEASAQLRAARLDPVLMGDQVRQACVDWLSAEASRRPLVIAIEDLHWGDAPSVKLVDVALRRLERAPLLVAAFARPDVDSIFPSLWSGRITENIRLGELTSKSAARLVRAALGDETPEVVVARITEQAAGNAFFLEEIIRAYAEGQTSEAPPTVRAVLQRRLEGLEPDARRVLRAASVFGQTFWTSGVTALLGGESTPVTRAGDWLARLIDRELVSRRPASRFADQEELVFRHAIVRDAAYDMLTDDDRALGHRLAGEWLERQGERDAVVLAQHFDTGSEKARAATYYVHAASQALEANDLAASAMLGESAVACGIGGTMLGEVRRLQAEAARWMGQIADAEARATEAVALLPPASSSWYGALGELATLAGNQGHAEVVERVRRTLVDTGSEGEPAARVIAIARVALQLFLVGIRAGDALLEIAEGIEVGDHPLARARLGQARSYRALSLGDYGTYYRNVLASRDLYDSIGDRRNACVQNSNLAYSTLFFGAHEDAEAAIAVARASARALGLARMIAFGDQKLGQVRFEQSRFAESIEIQRRALEQLIEQGDARLASSSRASLAWALEASGNVTAAFEQAHAAITDAALVPPALAVARATLADLELHHGSRSAALELAARANATLDELGGAEHAATFIRVVCAEALHAHGRDAEARAILAPELARLMAQAANAPRPEWRTWVFERVHHHRRARDLATKWRLLV